MKEKSQTDRKRMRDTEELVWLLETFCWGSSEIEGDTLVEDALFFRAIEGKQIWKTIYTPSGSILDPIQTIVDLIWEKGSRVPCEPEPEINDYVQGIEVGQLTSYK